MYFMPKRKNEHPWYHGYNPIGSIEDKFTIKFRDSCLSKDGRWKIEV